LPSVSSAPKARSGAASSRRGPSGANVTVTWPQGTLLEADEVSGPWTTNTAASPYVTTPAAAKKFYRVIVK